MKWSDIGDLVGTAAPLVGTLLGGPPGAAIGALVAQALGSDPTPEAVGAAFSSDPEATAKLRMLEEANEARFREMVLQAETNRLTEINKTIRAEAASSDAYVRRWRPTWGYATSATWTLQTVAICGALVFSFKQPEYGAEILGATATLVTALLPQWATALAVLGINVNSRSRDKQVEAGQAPPTGILGAIATRLAGGAK
tara:strand:+ start:1459 stop:2055 length:597 start_codon:yes stop_codon:yes gene_type:complete